MSIGSGTEETKPRRKSPQISKNKNNNKRMLRKKACQESSNDEEDDNSEEDSSDDENSITFDGKYLSYVNTLSTNLERSYLFDYFKQNKL